MGLNARQKLFVKEYLKTRNATKSASAAGYTKKNSREAGSRILSNPDVRAAIDARLERVTEKAELSVAAVLKEIQMLAFVDNTKAFTQNGELIPLHEMPEDVRKSIVGVETVELFAGKGANKVKVGRARKIKSTDKMKALEMLGRHLKMFTDVTEVTGKDGGPQVVLTMPGNGSEAEDE